MQTQNAYTQFAENFLRSRGIVDAHRIAEICSGFDFTQPVYESLVEPGDRLFQFIRMPQAGHPFMNTGNWFSIHGADMDGVAIFSGLAGRVHTEFTVARRISVLEGTAVSLPRNWDWAGGGSGGATQIFVADQDLLALSAPGDF